MKKYPALFTQLRIRGVLGRLHTASMRRIKSVTLTLPAVTGPYTSINCTLTLLKNKIRTDANAQGDYGEQDNDSRLEENMGFRTPNGLERARTPTLVVVGEREEGDAPLGLRIVAVLPNAPGRLAKGVGHNWSLEAPELFTRMVKASINDEPLPSKLLSSGEY